MDGIPNHITTKFPQVASVLFLCYPLITQGDFPWKNYSMKGLNMEIRKEGVESVEVNDMYTPFTENSMDKYGRKLARHLIKKIANNFDQRLLGDIVVCDVSREQDAAAKYEIVDGNHRIHAIRRVYGDDTTVDVKVVPYMDEASRANLFLELNNNRTRVSSTDKFKASVIAGRTIENEIWRILQRRGLNVKGLNSIAWPSVNGVHDIRQIYTKDPRPEGLLDMTIQCIIKAYDGTSSEYRQKAFHREGLQMVAGFLFKVLDKPQFDKTKLINTLRSKSSVEWAADFQQFQTLAGETDEDGANWVIGGYGVLRKAYNKNFKKKENKV